MLLFKEKKKLINLLNHWIHVNTKKIKHKKCTLQKWLRNYMALQLSELQYITAITETDI